MSYTYSAQLALLSANGYQCPPAGHLRFNEMHGGGWQIRLVRSVSLRWPFETLLAFFGLPTQSRSAPAGGYLCLRRMPRVLVLSKAFKKVFAWHVRCLAGTLRICQSHQMMGPVPLRIVMAILTFIHTRQVTYIITCQWFEQSHELSPY